MKMTYEKKQILLLIGFFIVAVVLWNTPFIYPIKIFVVMLHELSHGLMAILFGGSIVEIQIDSRIGGYCKFTFSGSSFARFWIASAGYLGSLIWGGIILLTAAKTKKDHYISLAIGILSVFIGWFVIKTGELFGIVFVFGFAAVMIASSIFIRKGNFHDYFTKFIGFVSCLYVLLDIKSDLIDRTGIGSDADTIAKLTGIPSILVGIFWGLVAIGLLGLFLFKAYKISQNNKEGGSSVSSAE